jgi:hypothetical protein
VGRRLTITAGREPIPATHPIASDLGNRYYYIARPKWRILETLN